MSGKKRCTFGKAGEQGFTLIEMAIVIVIVGLLVGMGATMVGTLTKNIKVRTCKDLLDDTVQSLASYASANNSLPSTTGFATVAKSPQDAWGRDFVYIYDDNLYRLSPTKDTICGRSSTFLNLSTSDPAGYIKNVAYIVGSSGESNTFKSIYTGGSTGLVTRANKNVSAATTFHLNPSNKTLDLDIVKWVTLDELRTKMGCQGAQLKIVNNELPFASVGARYKAVLYPDGGVSPYKWCLQYTSTSLPGGIVAGSNVVNTTCPASFTSASAAFAALSTSTIATSSQGSYNIIAYVQDSGGNKASKSFVLTINPN